MKNIDIEDYIPFGIDNAIRREELVKLTGLSDNKIRMHIASATRKGVLIINLGDGSGYFRPNKDELPFVRRYYNSERNRTIAIHKKMKALSAWIADVEAGRYVQH